MTRKEYVTTGYFWGKDGCQYEVYVLSGRRLSPKQANELALKKYEQYCLDHPELPENESGDAFKEYQYNKVKV